MIPHHTVTMDLKAHPDAVAPAGGGCYIALFAHHESRDVLEALSAVRTRSFDAFLKQLNHFRRLGLTAMWKGGEVKGGNTFFGRLDTLSSMVNTGRKDLPIALKMHEKVLREGGFVHVIMLPVDGFHNERVMMRALTAKHDIEFDNYGSRGNGKPVKKVRAPYRPYLFRV
jgi:hypothetical protein